MSPSVTVCIGVYNGAARLPHALASVRGQTFPDYSVLVVDDGSTDESARIAEEWGARVLRLDHGGLGAAREQMVLEAQTDLIAFLDDDDEWLPKKLEVQIEAHLAAGAVLSHTGGWWVWPDGRRELRDVRPTDATCSYDHVLPVNRIMAPSVVFDRRAMLEAGNFSATVRFASDWYGWLKLARMGEFAYIEEPLLNYTKREGQNTSLGLRFLEVERHMLEDEILGDWETIASRAPTDRKRRYRAGLHAYLGQLNELVGRHHWVHNHSRKDAIRFALRAIRHAPRRRTPYTMIARLLVAPRTVKIS